jgi:hypothetical protein
MVPGTAAKVEIIVRIVACQVGLGSEDVSYILCLLFENESDDVYWWVCNYTVATCKPYTLVVLNPKPEHARKLCGSITLELGTWTSQVVRVPSGTRTT